MPPEAPNPGIYQHYKGPLYEVIDCARHSETEEWLVVYRTLYGDFSLWVRPLEMFVETVLHEGATKPRFAFVRNSNDPSTPDEATHPAR